MPDKSRLFIRARAIQSIREFFINRGYLEVETPVVIPAPAPEANIDAIEASGWFLQTSPELCMKRLLAFGYNQIFQICKCFRKAERGERHLPEFTMLEWYKTETDYLFLMDECEQMIRHVTRALDKGERLFFQGKDIDISGAWERITVRDAFLKYAGITPERAIEAGTYDEIMVTEIEPSLDMGRPVFLYDYPASQAALSRTKKDDPGVAERFELYMGGLELANAFSELTNVDEQKKRFLEELASRKRNGKTAYPFPDKFINDLEFMPWSAGIAFGVDRLIMLLTDSPSIDDVVTFTPERL
ncbi:MAG: EF-P lysine aminoacylase GenX [Deltaproteobacteria bacterium]|nr:EF-P lysine aminoacylase GenX [Deltaproteobacteria bacterium]